MQQLGNTADIWTFEWKSGILSVSKMYKHMMGPSVAHHSGTASLHSHAGTSLHQIDTEEYLLLMTLSSSSKSSHHRLPWILLFSDAGTYGCK